MASTSRSLYQARRGREISRLFSSVSSSKPVTKLRPDAYDFSHEPIYTAEHVELRDAFRKFIDKEINPFVDEWERQKMFPAHELFKKLGQAGYLGVSKPVELGGQGLDYSFTVALTEELGILNTIYRRSFLIFSNVLIQEYK